MQVEQINIEEILPYINNSKVHNKKQIDKIAASIKEFGFNNPILIDNDKTVIAGHARLEAANKLKLKKVPCIKLGHLTEAQKKAYIIADNRLGEIESEWDWDILKIEVQDILNEDINIDLIGFELDDFDFGEEQVFEGDPDEIPEDVEPRCKLGDIWQLGDHRLMCGDSTKEKNIKQLLSGKIGDVLFTDPPYDLEDYSWIEHVKNCPKKFIMAADKQCIYICNKINNFRHFFVVQKNPPTMISNSRPMQGHTLISFFCDGKVDFINTKDQFSTLISKELAKNENIKSKDTEHKQEKKVGIPETFIKHFTKKRDLIVDIFLGSGSTLIASEKTSRVCYGLELDPKYCDVIIKRWEDFTGKTAELIENIYE